MENTHNKPSGGPGAPATSQELATLDFYGRPLLAPRGDGGLPEISLVVVTDMLMTSALTVRELLRLGEVTESHGKAARWPSGGTKTRTTAAAPAPVEGGRSEGGRPEGEAQENEGHISL